MRPSQFNASATEPDGSVLVFNSLNSSFYQFPQALASEVKRLLSGLGSDDAELIDFLSELGVLVPGDLDEQQLARQLHEMSFDSDRSLGLMLMAHENCNFRCTYCYESFQKNRMKPEVVKGIEALVRGRAETLESLNVGWFGGEPLLAFDVVETLSQNLREFCETKGIAYSSQMTTNGFLLDEERAPRCISAGITRFQVTLDGPAEFHNRSRKMANGRATFETILRNLCFLRDTSNGFHVAIRVNFSPENLTAMQEFVGFLGAKFGGDSRFTVRFRPVGRWGGDNDKTLEVCEFDEGENTEVELMRLALDAGFGMDSWRQLMQPYGTVCYAASPKHFVIGSDGMVYKCTVAFDDPRNHVGKLDSEGNLHLRKSLMRLWTRSGEEKDTGCQSCNFRPACQGNLCPLERINHGEKRCPTVRTRIREVLPVLAEEARRHRVAQE